METLLPQVFEINPRRRPDQTSAACGTTSARTRDRGEVASAPATNSSISVRSSRWSRGKKRPASGELQTVPLIAKSSVPGVP